MEETLLETWWPRSVGKRYVDGFLYVGKRHGYLCFSVNAHQNMTPAVKDFNKQLYRTTCSILLVTFSSLRNDTHKNCSLQKEKFILSYSFSLWFTGSRVGTGWQGNMATQSRSREKGRAFEGDILFQVTLAMTHLKLVPLPNSTFSCWTHQWINSLMHIAPTWFTHFETHVALWGNTLYLNRYIIPVCIFPQPLLFLPNRLMKKSGYGGREAFMQEFIELDFHLRKLT